VGHRGAVRRRRVSVPKRKRRESHGDEHGNLGLDIAGYRRGAAGEAKAVSRSTPSVSMQGARLSEDEMMYPRKLCHVLRVRNIEGGLVLDSMLQSEANGMLTSWALIGQEQVPSAGAD
jgi:hypothetical protein